MFFIPRDDGYVRFAPSFTGGYEYDNPLTTIKNIIEKLNNLGYILTFTKLFDLNILLKTEYLHGEEEEAPEEEEQEEEQVINADKIFKSDECVICFNKPPNILFCNWGHTPICGECKEMKPLNICPVCKTSNSIKRVIE